MLNTTVGPIDKAEELTRARRKLDYACSYLRAFQAENQKQIAKESRDIEAFLSGCITACASIYYTLTRTDAPASSWIAEAKQWKASLDIGDREFLNRMFSSRGDDFHRCAFVVDFQLRW